MSIIEAKVVIELRYGGEGCTRTKKFAPQPGDWVLAHRWVQNQLKSAEGRGLSATGWISSRPD